MHSRESINISYFYITKSNSSIQYLFTFPTNFGRKNLHHLFIFLKIYNKKKEFCIINIFVFNHIKSEEQKQQ